MAIPSSTPQQNVVIRFPLATADDAQESYQLLELPPDILKQVELGQQTLPLTIKGRPSDDAVLCTPTSTYLLRTVGISNSLLVLRPPAASSSLASSSTSVSTRPTLQIRDVKHEILECVPQAANVERIRSLLRHSAWGGLEEERELAQAAETDHDGQLARKRRRQNGKGEEGRRYTRSQLESIIQASEAELKQGLKDRNVIEIEGRLLMLPSPALQPLLSLLLTLITIHAAKEDFSADEPVVRIPVRAALDTLAEDQDVRPELVRGVMGLYGTVTGDAAGEDGQDQDRAEEDEEEDVWRARVPEMVREVGRGLLYSLSAEGEPKDEFTRRWRREVGDSWAHLVDLKLLQGEHLLSPTAPTSSLVAPSPRLIPFPLHTLPIHPATRFSDLFLTRAKWRPDEMSPFLRGLYREGDTKERDRLVAKFVRVVKEKDGTWWYPRRAA